MFPPFMATNKKWFFGGFFFFFFGGGGVWRGTLSTIFQ